MRRGRRVYRLRCPHTGSAITYMFWSSTDIATADGSSPLSECFCQLYNAFCRPGSLLAIVDARLAECQGRRCRRGRPAILCRTLHLSHGRIRILNHVLISVRLCSRGLAIRSATANSTTMELENELQKVRLLITSTLPHTKRPALLLEAIESTLNEQATGSKLIPTAYFASLIATLDSLVLHTSAHSEEKDELAAA